MTHETAHWDDEKKILFVETKSDRSDPTRKTSFWDVDPQVQIIALLTDMKALLGKLLEHTAPYHSGSQTVTVASPAGTESQDPEPAPETA